MTFTFVSNYINHHQIPFCEALYQRLGKDFTFIQTMPMEAERVEMGWRVEIDEIPYVMCLYDDEYECLKIIAESDVVLFGWTGREDIVTPRLQSGKTTFRVSERLYREGQWKAVSPRGLIAKYREHIRYRKQNVCMLCAGAYAASDFHLIGAYPEKLFRWGYFTALRTYDDEAFASLKETGCPLQIVWAGRFIPLKHPEYVVRLAKTLRQKGHAFHVHMAGGGELEAAIRQEVQREELSDAFTFYGFTPPERVRDIMERCHIHLFTSNHLEGWGAVVNEGMNSGCVEVVNAEVGAAPYLIRHGINGLLYPNGRYDRMEALVLDLFENWEEKKQMGRAAYETIRDLWNADHAAAAMLRFAEKLRQGEIRPEAEGPLSIAPIIRPGSIKI
ncbi:MAG: glycosyltransferase family 4 protein [Bacteroidales bacterium]|nr:glycosyltransferase family 4 protein [Bacteroidales bacterium]MCM1415525.1 glycosyltransferase family 4 protein [bacterium]MCM1423725.1 glycosyltransferase family 4 protein [bacterium]